MAKSSRLAPEQLATLARLRTVPALAGFYLAGGCAIAHHLGHRESLDLDLFSIDGDVDLGRVRRAVVAELDAEVVAATDAAVSIKAATVALDLVCFPYAPLESPGPGPAGFPVAGLRDLATNKLAAIAKRGIHRDFWDLFQMASRGSPLLDHALDDYVDRFGVAEGDLYHVLRALTYFDDAEVEPIMPRGMTDELWGRIKRFFIREAPRAAAARLAR